MGKTNGALGGEDLSAVLIRLVNDGGLQFPITNDNIKAIMFDMFAAGTETSSSKTCLGNGANEEKPKCNCQSSSRSARSL
ncbi:hypothetical protein RDI58_010948 [Solanum bulbocastanum]|uniref:Uncharacterized protein n=1 Tax=Solanum bulbocastanum TaxID=147425 RepID=A0AAN8TUN7_SOLBU